MVNSNTIKIAALSLAFIAVIITLAAIAVISSSQDMDSSGTITTINVEVYSDAGCAQPCSTINVGTLNPGSTITQNVYVKNTGTVPVTLSMNTSNWDPTYISKYLTLSWNRENYVLNAGTSLKAMLTLSVATNTDSLETFSFTATITGIQ